MKKTLKKWCRSLKKLKANPVGFFKKKYYKIFYTIMCKVGFIDSLIENRFIFSRMLSRSKTLPIKNFLHSGIVGDLIYALPTCKAMAKGENFTIHLNLPQEPKIFSNKAVENTVDFRKYFLTVLDHLKALLNYQSDVTLVQYEEKNYDKCFDLDIWRDVKKYDNFMPVYDMVKVYQYVFPCNIDLTKPWLNAPKDEKYQDAIVCTRNDRWKNKNISYEFLKKYPKVYFIGLENEYKNLNIPEITYLPVEDFLEAATIINSCKVFVSSQTFFFALAEALKSPRVLEVCLKTPDVYCVGGTCCECIYQDCFEYAVDRIYKNQF